MLEPSEHCPRCFAADYCKKRRLCGFCSKRTLATTRMAAAFDYVGPAATLIQQMKYGGQPYLAKAAAAFMAVQFYALEWPLPDAIVPVPVSFMRQLQRGFNQSLEMAENLSFYLKRPVRQALRRRSGGHSQAGLPRSLRLQLDSAKFVVKKNAELYDKIILLIDDVSTTSTTLHSCAEALQEQCPQAVYALTFCKAYAP